MRHRIFSLFKLKTQVIFNVNQRTGARPAVMTAALALHRV